MSNPINTVKTHYEFTESNTTALDIAKRIMQIIRQENVLPEHKLFGLELLAKSLGYIDTGKDKD